MHEVTTSELNGVLNLHLGSAWIQGSMRLTQPDQIELDYARQMMAWTLFVSQPKHILQLGLGAGALTKFCYRRFTRAKVVAVELSASVIAICESQFHLPENDDRLSVVQMDALDFVLDTTNHGFFDVLQIDLYSRDANGPSLDTSQFYAACAQCLTDDGVATINILGSDANKNKSISTIQSQFEAVAWLPETPDGNVIVIAFKRAPQIDFVSLYERAAVINNTLALPAQEWVDGFHDWMQGKF